MINEKICQETELRVLLPAEEIPDGATVSKRTGEERYVLRHNLRVFPDDELRRSGAVVFDVTGYFMIGARGNVTQVQGKKMIHWVVVAEDFVETIQNSWSAKQ